MQEVQNLPSGPPFTLTSPSISARGAVTTEYLSHSPVSPETLAMLGGGRHSVAGQPVMNSLQMLVERSMSRTSSSSVASGHGVPVDSFDSTSVGSVTPPSFNLNALTNLGASASGW